MFHSQPGVPHMWIGSSHTYIMRSLAQMLAPVSGQCIVNCCSYLQSKDAYQSLNQLFFVAGSLPQVASINGCCMNENGWMHGQLNTHTHGVVLVGLQPSAFPLALQLFPVPCSFPPVKAHVCQMCGLPKACHRAWLLLCASLPLTPPQPSIDSLVQSVLLWTCTGSPALEFFTSLYLCSNFGFPLRSSAGFNLLGLRDLKHNQLFRWDVWNLICFRGTVFPS